MDLVVYLITLQRNPLTQRLYETTCFTKCKCPFLIIHEKQSLLLLTNQAVADL